MERTTRQKNLEEALSLFSEKGYEAVSVVQIAVAVGIKAPSLYKHYKSKQDIFQAILDEMDARYEKQAGAMQMNGTDAHADVALFSNISEEMLVKMGKELFLYFLHDDYVCKFRKMLTIEQYHSEELAVLCTKQYVDDPLSYQGMMFGMLSYWGISYIKPYGISLQAMDWQSVAEKKKTKIEKDIAKLAEKVKKAVPRTSLKTKMIFTIMGNMQKAGMGSSPSEKVYWEDMGWLSGKKPW